MEIDSSRQGSPFAGPFLGGGGGTLAVAPSPVYSPQEETLTAGPSLPAPELESAPEAAEEDHQSWADRWPDRRDPTESPSHMAMFRPNRGPSGSRFWNRHRWGSPWGDNDRFVPMPRKVIPSGVGAGLENLGLTCFVNAVLQCLTHTAPFVQSLRSLDHASPCDRDREAFCLLCALREQIEVSLDSSGKIVSPSKLVDNLNQISSYFRINQQEDAHEFQQAMLDKLERCCMGQRRDSESPPPKNVVDEVFGGRLISKLKCCNCGHSSCSYEPLIDLSLEIENADNLNAALESFTDVEKMEDPESKFRCESCNEDVSLEKQLQVEKEPTIVALHLKRFKSDGVTVEKIDKHVPFPLELDLRPFTNGRESDVELKYHLYAVVVHTGMSPTWGHYFSFIQSSPGVWRKFDDSKVSRVQEDFVLSQDAYTLFYAKHDTPWFSSFMEEWMTTRADLISETSPKSVLDYVDTSGSSTLTPNSSSRDSSTSYGTAKSFSSTSDPSLAHEKVHTYIPQTINSNTDGSIYEVPMMVFSRNGSDEVMTETGVEEDVPKGRGSDNAFVESLFANERNTTGGGSSNVDDCFNHGQEIEMDEKFGPLTPPGSPSPQSPDEVQDKRPSETSNSPTELQHHKKAERSSFKRQPSKSLEDPKRKEAMRYMKKMPTSRSAKLMQAMLGAQSPGSMKKSAKRRMAASLCERVSPSSARHRSRSSEPIFAPAVL